ncbi:hypothetical protein BH09GEM1_BH09GEM1_04410 [soil metagenome]
MSSRPTFSILIATSNQAEPLGPAFDSLLAQSDPDWEAVVVHSGSSDAASGTLAALEHRDARIRVIHVPSGGERSALNYGLRNARGAWVCRLSADDVYLPNKLDIHRQWFALEPATRFFHTDVIARAAEGAGPERALAPRDMPHREWQVLELLRDMYIHRSSVCIRRDIMLGVDGFDERLHHRQDYDLWLRILTSHAATFIPERTCIESQFSSKAATALPEALSYDSARAAIELLNTHTLGQLIPALDLDNADVAERVVERTIDVASTARSPFLYGLGPHALLVWRLVEWALGHHDDGVVRKRSQSVVRRIGRSLRRSVESPIRLQWKCAVAVLRAVEGTYSYSPVSPAQIALARIAALRASRSPEGDVLLEYLYAAGESPHNLGREPSDFLATREVVIVSQRGSVVDADIKFGAARAQMALARHVVQRAGQVVLIGLSTRRHGYTEDTEFLGAPTEAGVLDLLESIAPHDVVVGISRADVFRRVSAARPMVYQHGPHSPEGDPGAACVRRQRIPVVVVSADSLEAQVGFGMSRDQLYLVPNGYDSTVFTMGNRDERRHHRLVFAGNGVSYKGPDIAVGAFALLKHEFPDAEFQLFGTTVEAWANSDHVWSARWLGADGRVSWEMVQADVPGVIHLGGVTPERLAAAFREASLLVMPSRIPETFGLVSIEAQACGCLPVLPRIGGYSSTMVPEQTGYLYDDNTPTGLAARVAALWRNGLPSDAQRAEAARRVRGEFSWDKADRAICGILERQTSRIQSHPKLNELAWATEQALRHHAGSVLGSILRRFRGRPWRAR